ncbi:MAG: lipopolysaccharide heptosyltransferase II [Gammaproteobacteria bacterium]|nr:lipopolysaccharide heptosyltransferase II [Gammaproteobacteria bacterium]
MSDNSRILVVGPSWVGDMVMAQSLFKVLRQQQSGVEIDVLAPGWSLPLLQRMPEVAAGMEMPVGHGRLDLKVRYQLGRSLVARQYDQAILLPNSLKSALIPFWAKIPQRTGWLGEMRYGLLNDIRGLDKSVLTMTVQRFVALAHPPGVGVVADIPVPQLEVSASNVAAAMEDLGLAKGEERLLVLCPGAEYGPAKCWPQEYYGALAARLMEQGWAVWLFGSEKDQMVCAAINAAAGGRCEDLSGRTTLAQAVDLMSMADGVVSNDSGLMHVAAALDRPLVAIYGSSDPGFTPPLNESSRVLHLGLDCGPCFKRECPEGHLKCLTGIDVDMVAASLQQVVQGIEVDDKE